MIKVIALAVALSMDAFAVSIGLGAKRVGEASRLQYKLALKAGLYFGFFQALMAWFGHLISIGVGAWMLHDVELYTAWIGAALLFFIGGKMISEAMFADSEDEPEDDAQSAKEAPAADVIIRAGKPDLESRAFMLTLAIATSIDAMAAGFSLQLLSNTPALSVLWIGLVTFAFSWLGVYLSRWTGTLFESKAELFGGLVLVGIGVKLLLT